MDSNKAFVRFQRASERTLLDVSLKPLGENLADGESLGREGQIARTSLKSFGELH